MAHPTSCISGKSYKTKREAERAGGGAAKRCDRCKLWHPAPAGKKKR